mmetsp:Transcript_166710/g.405138  ORF Transcript_166710/g.405138 Transcript_166710/m.405138 type:complete len:219 (-) Transcript_166710:3256-3912(-)
MFTTHAHRFAAAKDLETIESYEKLGFEVYGSSAVTSFSVITVASYDFKRCRKSSTLAIIFFARSQDLFLNSFSNIMRQQAVMSSTPPGGFGKDFNSVNDALSRQSTAFFAAIIAGSASASSASASRCVLSAAAAADDAFSASTFANACCSSASPRCFPIITRSSSVASTFSFTLTIVCCRSTCSSATSAAVFRSVDRPTSRRSMRRPTEARFSARMCL